MRLSADRYFMDIAILVSKRSTCVRRSVGCVVVNELNQIKATGYNGVPRSQPHCIDVPCSGASAASGTKLESCMAIHAEQNALIQCENVNAIHTIYSTTFPCITCAKMIANTSCKRIVYLDEYDHPEAIRILAAAGIKFERISN